DRVDVNFEQGGGEVEIDWQSASQMVMTPVHAKTGELRTEQAMTYRRLADRSEIPPIRATAEPLLASEDLVGTWRLKLSYSDTQIADMHAKYPERAADWTDDALAEHVDQYDSKTAYEFREDGTFELRGTGDSSDVVRPGRYEVVVIEDATRLVLYFDGYGNSQAEGLHVVAFEPNHVLIQLVRSSSINEGYPVFDQYELVRSSGSSNMVKFILGIVVASVALFFWGFLFWGLGPYPTLIWKQPTDIDVTRLALAEQFPEAGTYFIPPYTGDDDAFQTGYEEGPVAFVQMLAPDGRPAMDASIMIRGFGLNVVVIILLATLLKQVVVATPSYLSRVWVATLVGLIAAVFIDVGDTAWWGIALEWKLYQAAYHVSAAVVVGAVLGLFITPTVQPAQDGAADAA
ncbi:Uncharacterized protein SCF082_LOCUS17859, partial [Durusdinium trenchii]